MSTDVEWEFVPKESMPVKDSVKSITTSSRDRKKADIPAGTAIKEYVSRGRVMYSGICPIQECGHVTVGSLNEIGAGKTINFHVKVAHGRKR